MLAPAGRNFASSSDKSLFHRGFLEQNNPEASSFVSSFRDADCLLESPPSGILKLPG